MLQVWQPENKVHEHFVPNSTDVTNMPSSNVKLMQNNITQPTPNSELSPGARKALERRLLTLKLPKQRFGVLSCGLSGCGGRSSAGALPVLCWCSAGALPVFCWCSAGALPVPHVDGVWLALVKDCRCVAGSGAWLVPLRCSAGYDARHHVGGVDGPTSRQGSVAACCLPSTWRLVGQRLI